MPQPSRRHLLAGFAAALGAPLLAGATAAPPIGIHAPPTGHPDPGLHARAQKKGLFFGSVVDNATLRGDPATMACIATDCGMLGATAGFRWTELHPSPDRYAFERADMLLAFATRHAMRVRGSPLLWHHAHPARMAASLSPTQMERAQMERALTTHIARVGTHFRGRLAHWDVAQDIIRAEAGSPSGLRDTPWLHALGPRYLDLAFQSCASADPAALRVLSEGGLTYADPASTARRAALLACLADLKSRAVPVQAVALQARLDAARTDFDQAGLARFCADIAGLDLKLIVTMFSVHAPPGRPTSREGAITAHARAWLDTVLDNRAVLGVMAASLTDRHPAIDAAASAERDSYPLDRELRRKPLWQVLATAFDTAPARGST